MITTICYIIAVAGTLLSGACIIITLSFISRLLGWRKWDCWIAWICLKIDQILYWVLKTLLGKPEIKP